MGSHNRLLIEDFLGKRFGHLVAIGEAAKGRKGCMRVECKCDCGATADIVAYYLLNGDTTTCGCRTGLPDEEQALCAEARSIRTAALGASNDPNIWDERLTDDLIIRFMTSKCYYAGRGWGPCGDKYETKGSRSGQRGLVVYRNGLDRKDPNGKYEPGNVVPCCWRHNRLKSDWTVERARSFIKVHEEAVGKTLEDLLVPDPTRGVFRPPAVESESSAPAEGEASSTSDQGYVYSEWADPDQNVK